MKKLIDIWFEAESYTVKFTSYEYVITVLKYIGTILQLLLCTIVFIFLLIFGIISLGIDKINTLKLHKPKRKEPFKPLTQGYNKHGFPDDVKRTDGHLSEKEYENMRKVL